MKKEETKIFMCVADAFIDDQRILFIAKQGNKREDKDGQYTYVEIIYVSGLSASIIYYESLIMHSFKWKSLMFD